MKPLIILLFTAQMTFAGWSADIWPSQSWLFAGSRRAAETAAAVNERIYAAGWSNYWSNPDPDPQTYGLIPNVGFFATRTTLLRAKQKLPLLIPYFKDSTVANITNTLATAGALPDLTVSNVLLRAGAPSDYFDNTPYFNLATDSNGYRFITVIVSQLRWTMPRFAGEEGWNDYATYSAHTRTNDYGILTTDYISQWSATNVPGGRNIIGAYSHFDGDGTWRELWGWRETANYNINTYAVPTNLQHSIAFYIKAEKYTGGPYGYDADTNRFNNNSDSVIEGWRFYATAAESPDAFRSQQYGSQPASAVAVPAFDYTGTSAEGWTLAGQLALIKWDGPNGFKYK